LGFYPCKSVGNDNGKTIDAYGLFASSVISSMIYGQKPIISIRESYASGGKKNGFKNIRTFEPALGAVINTTAG
jgi:hypothetical protein